MKISDITQGIAFSEFNYVEEHQKHFEKSELGILKSLLPMQELINLFSPRPQWRAKQGRPELLSTETKVCLLILKSKTRLSDKELIARLNTDIHFQLFCNIYIPAGKPLLDFKILSKVRTDFGKKFNMEEFQKIIATSLKKHIQPNELKITASDATCYCSYVRFPTNEKLLRESVEYLYKIMKNICYILNIRMPRTKYISVTAAYHSFSKTRKKSYSKKRKISRRLINLTSKLINEIATLQTTYKFSLTSKQSRDYSIIKNILEQQIKLFNKEKVKSRIISIDKPYLHPIVRGKEVNNVEFGAKVNAIQVGGFNFVEHLNFNAFHEGKRVPECVLLHQILFKVKPRFFAGDAIYATNANRSFCKENDIFTNFVPKGVRPKNDKEARVLRKELNVMRSTVLEGSFGVEKNNYSLNKIKARTKKNEILWIVFSIHTANFCRLVSRKIEEIKASDIRVRKSA